MLNVVDVVIAQLRAAVEARNCSDAEPPAKRVVVKRTSALDGVAVAPLGGASSIQTLSPLGIVGVGTSPSVEHAVTLSWVLSVAPHVATLPGLMISLTALSFNLVGDGLRFALDPRTRAALGPDAGPRALLANAGFLRKPDFARPAGARGIAARASPAKCF